MIAVGPPGAGQKVLTCRPSHRLCASAVIPPLATTPLSTLDPWPSSTTLASESLPVTAPPACRRSRRAQVIVLTRRARVEDLTSRVLVRFILCACVRACVRVIVAAMCCVCVRVYVICMCICIYYLYICVYIYILWRERVRAGNCFAPPSGQALGDSGLTSGPFAFGVNGLTVSSSSRGRSWYFDPAVQSLTALKIWPPVWSKFDLVVAFF